MMKNALLLMLAFFVFATSNAQSGLLQDAEAKAKQSNKFILLNFSGSDWCIPCIRLEKEVFEKEAFVTYAADKLIMLHADFPRQKKHLPSKEIIQQNEALAEQYNKKGNFPYTVLLDSNGKVLKSWEGLTNPNAEAFVKDLQTVIDAGK